MKPNDVLYQLQKLIKMLRKGNVDRTYFLAKLKGMVEFCKELELKEEKKTFSQLIGLLHETELRKQLIVKKMGKLTSKFGAMVEKERVMQRREASARATFFKNKQTATASILQFGDVIKVPTQGGFHYSVVTNIQKDMVECYPLTTASINDLNKLGVESIAIDDFLIIDGIERSVRLTASKTRIPARNAACNKIGTYTNIGWLKEAIKELERK